MSKPAGTVVDLYGRPHRFFVKPESHALRCYLARVLTTQIAGDYDLDEREWNQQWKAFLEQLEEQGKAAGADEQATQRVQFFRGARVKSVN